MSTKNNKAPRILGMRHLDAEEGKDYKVVSLGEFVEMDWSKLKGARIYLQPYSNEIEIWFK